MIKRADEERDYGGVRGFWLGLAKLFGELGTVPLIAGLLGAVAYMLLATAQGPDLTHTMVQDGLGAPHFYGQVALLVLASTLLGGQAWFWSRRIIDDNCDDYRDQAKPNLLLLWLPRVLGGAPFVIALAAVLRSGEDLGVVAWILAVMGAGFVILLWARTYLLGQARDKGLLKAKTAGDSERTSNRVRDLGWLLALVYFTLEPIRVAQAFGAIGVVFIGVGMIIAVMGGIIHWGVRWRVPVVGLALLWAVLMSVLGAKLEADNHAIGRRAFGPALAAGPSPDARTDFQHAFGTWYAQAPALADGSKPLIVVAAAGGASRAGFWAAEVLGRLQDDSQGRFARSVFALSSVSGGSVGSGAFVSQLYDSPVPAKVSFREAVRGASKGDYLSPALGGLLFPDLAQRFLPTVPVGGGQVLALPDRAEALEKAFESGWRDHCDAAVGCRDRDLWKKPFLTLWPDPKAWSAPLWFVNGARQEDGRRVLTAPVKIEPADFPDAVDFYVATENRDIPISSAIHNGARFPLVSPGGTVLDHKGRAHGHILDGGYFENSGVTTAGDIVRAALKYAAQETAAGRPTRIRPILIELNNDAEANPFGPDFDRDGAAHKPPYLAASVSPMKTKYFLADLLGPLDGLSSGRDGRATPVAIAVSQGVAAAPGDYELIHLCNVRQPNLPVRHEPMDWVLSKDAQDDMALASVGCGNQSKLDAVLKALPPAPTAAPPPKTAAGG